jgi:hypothetical protein
MHLAHRNAGDAGDLVDIDGARSADDPLALALRDFGQGFRRCPFLRGGQLRAERFDRAAKDRRQSFDDVTRSGDEAGVLLEQIVGSGGTRGSRGLLGTAKTSRPCSPAKRAVISEPDLHHDNPERDAGDQAVAAGEILSARGKARAAFAGQESLFADGALKIGIFRRVHDVEAAGEHGDCPALERRETLWPARRQLGLSLSLGEDSDRGAAAAARQGRQGVERRLGAAELIDQPHGRVAGPTFSLRISLSQLSRWRSLSRIAERAESMLRSRSGLLRANAPLLASQQASDIVGVAPIEKHGEDQEQHRYPGLPHKKEQAGDCGARRERRKR